MGFEYQHRFYWIQACHLFNGTRNAAVVALEQPVIRAFDDVVTTYETPIIDAFGQSIKADHFQLKFHLTRREVIRASDLVSPKFIGATKVSLLERVRDAFAAGDIPRRLNLVTCWDIDTNDVLGELVANRSGEFEVQRFLSARSGSAIGRLREEWRALLGGVDDRLFERMLGRLQFEVHHRIEDLDRLLDLNLETAGLAPVDYTRTVHPYVALSQRFILDDTREHDAAALDAVLRRERLRVSDPVAARNDEKTLAIKSFRQFAAELADSRDTLNLLALFHGRQTVEDVDWDRDVVPRVRDFLLDRVKLGQKYVLHFDTHLSVTYLAGVVLGKLPAMVFPARAGVIWRFDQVPAPATWTCAEEAIGDGPDLAIALEVARSIRADVTAYLRQCVPSGGRLLTLTIPGGASDTSVRDATHALALARGVGEVLRAVRTAAERERPLHLFLAAPAALVFLLGREGRTFGSTKTYEYDLERASPTAYSPALHVHSANVGGGSRS